MDFVRALKKSDSAQVGAAVITALEQLIERHRKLLELDASERAIAAQFAHLLKPLFAGHEVDVEYNRMGDAPKTVAWNDRPERVFPDIIVHVRLTNDDNVLAIELKKSSNPEKKADDVRKLKAYRRELHYQNALFIRLGVGDEAGVVTECEWVEA